MPRPGGLLDGVWERKGVCSGCGFCCEYTSVNRHTITPPKGKPFTETDVRYHQLRGAQVVPGDDGRPARFHLLTWSHAICSAYAQDERKCSIYDQRPAICRQFPQIPDQIEGTPCSYYFEATDGAGNVVRRGGHGSAYPTAPTFPEPERGA